MSDLKPCPFCGNAFPAVGYDSDMRALNRIESITARCRQCGSETRKFETAQEAIAAWNARATLAEIKGDSHE
jgi:Lar family restriction alleviation protein